MKLSAVRHLIDLNNRFYFDNANSFSATRQKPWSGWTKVTELLSEYLSGKLQGMTLLDFAAGNLRFEKYMLTKFNFGENVQFVAIDACRDLVSLEYMEQEKRISFIRTDILKQLADASATSKELLMPAIHADLTTCFGFFHHIPSFTLRQKMLDVLIECTSINGCIVISFWNFIHDEKSRFKASKATIEYSKIDGNSKVLEDFEPGDYVLGWQNKPNAYRYCHNFSKPEILKLIQNFTNHVQIIAQFTADGADNNQNLYVILKRIG